MAYDELLADRIRQTLTEKKKAFEETKMFGGICFMVNDKMCIGVLKNELMARIDPTKEDLYLTEEGARTMDLTHRPMKGFIFVEPEGTDMDNNLEKWVDRCLEYNPKASSSKKTKKK